MKAVEIEQREGDVEIGEIWSGEKHGESHAHIPFATCRVMYGCGEFGRYKLNFPARSSHSPRSLIWNGPRHDQMVEERTQLMDVHDRPPQR